MEAGKRKATKLKITLKRSVIGTLPDQRATVRALGLKKRHQVVIKPNIPAVRGMVKKIIHLVEVEEIND
jgi:large subunit ribosomal protein L30